MTLVVNDANVLIDFIKLAILKPFFELDFEFYTTDFVLYELHEHQQEQLESYIKQDILKIRTFKTEEILEVLQFQQQKPQLSPQDCSAFYCAQELNANLLTSDKLLRQWAAEKQVEVHGHLWILDQMVNAEKITGEKAKDCLHQLQTSINPKLGLSKGLCQPFLENWLKKNK